LASSFLTIDLSQESGKFGFMIFLKFVELVSMAVNTRFKITSVTFIPLPEIRSLLFVQITLSRLESNKLITMLLLKPVKVCYVSCITCLEILRGLIEVCSVLKLNAFDQDGVLQFNRLCVLFMQCLKVHNKIIVSRFDRVDVESVFGL
jgi:hypothetical protein